MFSCSVAVELGDGALALFWSDSWQPAGPIASFAPHLFRAIGRRFLLVSIKDALSGRRWVGHITGAHTASVLYVRQPLGKIGGCTLAAACERSFHLVMDAGWYLLCVLGVPLVLPWYVLSVGSQGALEGLGVAES